MRLIGKSIIGKSKEGVLTRDSNPGFAGQFWANKVF